ncbi:hypothetical protein DFQ27_000599 [Actinomortierella ambigua]|uniref:Uncharacterized protein n=1 Tax=Actinomortierella ambigua TaxID=1343610 RepID=A0A9P6PNH0_9FUNG|nr:hypothetical protein DFQ27_000599 [Actinomortierella ambigua]
MDVAAAMVDESKWPERYSLEEHEYAEDFNNHYMEIQETQQEKEQAHKSLSTLKKQAYQRFDAIQDLTAAERFNVTGETDRGRRVDLLLCCEDLEILNSEAKFNESGLACERQYNKNLRINKAIWNIARRRGIRLLTMYPLDIRGTTAIVRALDSPDNQILLAGAASEFLLELPKDERGLQYAYLLPVSVDFYSSCASFPKNMLIQYVKNVEVMVSMAKSRQVTKRKRPLESQDNDTNGDTSRSSSSSNDGGDKTLPAQHTRRCVRSAQPDVESIPSQNQPLKLGHITF